jgi:hypothetical protein
MTKPEKELRKDAPPNFIRAQIATERLIGQLDRGLENAAKAAALKTMNSEIGSLCPNRGTRVVDR